MTGSKPTSAARFLSGRQRQTGLVEEAERAVSQGYRGMKMKIGRNPSTQSNLREMLPHHDMCVVSLEEDLARVAAVRQALGPERKLMVDIARLEPALAIQMGQAMAPYHLYWIEEPVATDDIRGSAEVARALGTAIAGYKRRLASMASRINHTTGDRYRATDLAWAGGFTECRRIARAGPCL